MAVCASKECEVSATEAGRELAKLSTAHRALVEASSLDEICKIRDMAVAARAFCQAAGKSLEIQNTATDIKLRAERKAGELLSEMSLNGGDRKSESRDARVNLDDLGISATQSSRWQSEARIPDEVFEAHVEAVKSAGKELTTASVLKLAKRQPIINEPTDDSSPELSTALARARAIDTAEKIVELAGCKFGCIYADPPWQYGNQATRASTGNHYDTMTVDELCEMPIASLAAEDAHLHLWTTNAFLFDAKRVLEAWGFEYRSVFVWVKPQMGIGNYWRLSHEFLVLGIRGDAKRFNDKSLKSWGEFERGKHSAKPEEVRLMVERASAGPYLELFGRKPIEGWTVFGNQIDMSKRLFAG